MIQRAETNRIRETAKKATAVFLSVLMILTAWVFVAPEKASAADVWDGNYSDSSGFQSNHIKSARALAWFVYNVNRNGQSYSGQTVYLDVDVDLGGRNFADGVLSGGYNDSNRFKGTFDGQNHTITGFKMVSSDHRVAMFRTTENATFRNLNFESVFIDDNSDSNHKNGFAVLSGYHGTGSLTFENVHVNSGNIYGYNYAGALVGEIGANSSGNSVTLTNCSNGANISALNVRIGGLVGSSLPAVYATNCSNTGSVTSGSTDVGGIVGWIEDDPSSFTGCSNSGAVQGTDAVGGIFGYFGKDSQDKKMTLTNNTNTGNITATNMRAGGIGGHIETDNNAHEITGNVNRGTITGGDDVGGIIGRNKGYGVWTNNKNYGSVTSTGDNAGGIVGEIEDDKQIFSNCTNAGAIHGKTSTGGIVGWLNTANENEFTRCFNTGNITSDTSYAGGIAGRGTKQLTCTECFNIGTVYSGGNDSGGLVGSIDYHTFFNRCFNAGNVTAPSGKSAGGLIGYTSYYGNDTSRRMVDDCYNWGTISAGTVGGLVGYVNGGREYKVEYSYNAGALSGSTTWQFVGHGGNCGSRCFKIVDTGSGEYKTPDEMEVYDFSIDYYFCKNTWGVRIGSTTYKYPILTWYRDMFSFENHFVDSATGTNQTILKNYGESFTVPNPTRSGYSCGQWISGKMHRLVRGSTVTAGDTYLMNTTYDKTMGPADTNIVVQSFEDPTIIRSTKTYGLDWHEGAAANMYAMAFADEQNNTNNRYRAGIDYTIYNLTTGHDSYYTVANGDSTVDWNKPSGRYFKTFQHAGTGNATATLEVDRSRKDNIEDTGIYIDYYPFIYTAPGGMRWGIEIFNPSDSNSKGVLDNTHHTATLTGTSGKTYTYQLHFGSVDGALRCAETMSGDFTKESTAHKAVERRYGTYKWYLTGPAPDVGDSVTLRVTAICSARYSSDNLQILSDWTDITITGTCSHSKGYNDTVTAPTCTETGYTTHVCKTSTCGNTYTDSSTSALGHLYNYPAATFNWNGYACPSATVTCSRDSSHTIDKNTSVTSAPAAAPEYDTAVDLVYTASFTENGTAYTATKTETNGVPALKSLTDWGDNGVVIKADDASKLTYTVAPLTKASDVSYSVEGLFSSVASEHPVLTEMPSGAASSVTLGHGKAKLADGVVTYRWTDMNVDSIDSFYALVKVSGVNTGSYKYGVNDVYTYAKITAVPSKNILFDDFTENITYISGENQPEGFGTWMQINNNDPTESAISTADDVMGYDGTALMYSLGAGHMVKVTTPKTTPAKTGWPTAQFTFTGSGFDLISVTDNAGGIFKVNVYQGSTVSGDPYRTKTVDTYYGYRYTTLFYNLHTERILADNHKGVDYVVPLYVAKADTPASERIYDGISGDIFYTTNETYAKTPVRQAYGWVATANNEALYQIPVIEMKDLPQGTYTVTVEARFSEIYRHYCIDSAGNKYFNMTIDGVRVYDPVNTSDPSLSVAADKYTADGETYVNYFNFRETVQSGDALVVAGKEVFSSDELADYIKMSPNNELYLKSGCTATFNIDASNSSDIRIGMKAIDGKPCKVRVTFPTNNSKEITVDSATEKYYSIRDLVGTNSGVLTIENISQNEAKLSMTKLMVTSNSAPELLAGSPRNRMSVNAKTLSEAIELLEMTNADLTIDEETVETASSDDGTVTLTLQTSEDAETIVIRDSEGNVIDPESIDFTIDEEGIKHWVVTLTESESGEFSYTLQAEYENGYAPEEPTTVTVTVTIPESEQETNDDQSALSMLAKLKGFFERLLEFFKKLISFFK